MTAYRVLASSRAYQVVQKRLAKFKTTIAMLKRHYSIIVAILSILATTTCTNVRHQTQVITGDKYEIHLARNQKAVLVLFPCYPCDIANTRTEAKFLKDLDREGITVLLLNINRKLWLTDAEKSEYATLLKDILDSNNIPNKNIFIGGFSSGGNVSLLLTHHILNTKFPINVNGVFAVDAPLDLEQLYKNALYDIEKNASEDAYNEALFVKGLLEKELGIPSKDLITYKQYSPYLISENSTQNIEQLKNLKIRFYTEPALDWQKENRNRDYNHLNAFVLEKVHHALTASGCQSTEFIASENKGIRANGTRHPHAWSIVDRGSLIKWMK
jgi:hypothetical protein